ncbi:MAG: phospholipase D family protein, partial [Gammaproteobacteria bacterium]|nr:phospholipase D family protein [Gammaproteobacteria bacterium]
KTSLLAMWTALAMCGCAALEPVARAPEYTPVAEAPLWDELASLYPGDWQVPLNEGPDALDWRLRAIDSATDSIDLQTFLWSFDTVGAAIIDHLVRAAERGVEIKILVDDTFLADEEAEFLALAAHENIQYRIYNPFLRRSSSMVTRQILNLGEFSRLNHRMHNKAMIVDNRVAIVGGRNLANEYFGLNDGPNFRDMELLLGGPVVAEISASFDAYWNDRWARPIDEVSHIRFQAADLEAVRKAARGQVPHREEAAAGRRAAWLAALSSAFNGEARLIVDTPPEENPAAASSAPVQLTAELALLIENARESILIVSAYLIPGPYLEGAIEAAAARGVDVRILTNSLRSNNHVTAHGAYRNHIRTLMGHGAQLHEVRTDAKDRLRYMLGPAARKSLALHAKFLIIDSDKVFIGSANLDPRSLRINTEMGVLVTSEPLNRALRSVVELDFSPANAWRLEFDDDGKVVWISDSETRRSQPADSAWQRLEDWVFSHLPMEGQL